MAKKTWKLGEVCRGGVITIEIKGTIVSIIGKEWDMSKGTSRGSNQSNAKEWTRIDVDSSLSSSNRQMTTFLLDLTTSYHCDKLMEWVSLKIKRVIHT